METNIENENKQLIKIYKIYSDLGNEIYIGSTCQKLQQRFTDHKTSKHNCRSKILFNKYGKENCKIELLEEKEINNKIERCILEQKFLNRYHDIKVNRQSALNKKNKIIYKDELI
jgi:hypothetical protein